MLAMTLIPSSGTWTNSRRKCGRSTARRVPQRVRVCGLAPPFTLNYTSDTDDQK